MSDTITINGTDLLVSVKETADGVKIKDTYTVIADGTDLGEVMKVGREWFVLAAGAEDYAEASVKTKKAALESLLPVAQEVEATEVPEVSDELVPLTGDEADALAQLLLNAGSDDEAEDEGDDEGPAVLEDEADEEKVTKNPRATCKICNRRVPAKKDGSVASHKGFKRNGARCDGTTDGLKYEGFATVREALAAPAAA